MASAGELSVGILSWFKAKDDSAAREAELLMQLMGDKAYRYIFARSRDLKLPDKERYHALKVRRIIERKLKDCRQVGHGN